MALGLYGKLPCQGDFVSRRLPWEFTQAWDDWLQAGLAQARTAIGADWHQTYLTAPLWRFQLAPGVLGAGGWAGLWFASVDRVGRQFPLTLVEPLPEGWRDRYVVLEQDEAYFPVEDVALRGLDPRIAFDAFDRSIESRSLLASVPSAALASVSSGLEAVSIDIDQIGARLLRLAADVDAGAALRTAQTAGRAESCFFTWGNEHHGPMLLRCSGLPSAAEFRGFLDGRWP
ncbi:type VI secretion system-associated protein TagF [Piscinibacter sakaiensis]|uniref:Protein phosphatase ImpM n=1 Tax=Piscinibacter sakaiensis TaxID=1547922 RepID=A0A0K8NWV1_PISS1|nr:type VI secretion system-associated protein TagF [Piscinibacter sakaiensis]GAP34877.1 protein phosphatase ImpM [Piscinibacter sakaiensis]